MSNIEGRIERLEKTTQISEKGGVQVIIIQSVGDPSPTREQVDEKLNKYMEEHPDYRGIVTLDLRSE